LNRESEVNPKIGINSERKFIIDIAKWAQTVREKVTCDHHRDARNRNIPRFASVLDAPSCKFLHKLRSSVTD